MTATLTARTPNVHEVHVFRVGAEFLVGGEAFVVCETTAWQGTLQVQAGQFTAYPKQAPWQLRTFELPFEFEFVNQWPFLIE